MASADATDAVVGRGDRAPDVADVAIVGAGVAGLAAARRLCNEGLNVMVFEARDRIGGRVESVGIDGGAADLGPTWFWPGEHRVRAVVDELGLSIHDQWISGDAVVASGEDRRRVPGPVTPPAFRFTDGAASLTDGLAATLPKSTVRCGTPVRRVSTGGNGLVVDTDDGPVRAGAVVVAIPPALAVGQGILTPADVGPETAEVAAATPTWMGATAKVVAVYDRPFWREHGLSGTAIDHGGPLNEIHDMSGPDGNPAALFGFAPMQTGRSAPSEPAVAAQLAGLFGPAAADPRRVMLRAWSAEQWTSADGGGPGNRYDLYGSAALTRPHADGRLVLASTETATTAPGHIEGALQAAERAVSVVLEAGTVGRR